MTRPGEGEVDEGRILSAIVYIVGMEMFARRTNDIAFANIFRIRFSCSTINIHIDFILWSEKMSKTIEHLFKPVDGDSCT